MQPPKPKITAGHVGGVFIMPPIFMYSTLLTRGLHKSHYHLRFWLESDPILHVGLMSDWSSHHLSLNPVTKYHVSLGASHDLRQQPSNAKDDLRLTRHDKP